MLLGSGFGDDKLNWEVHCSNLLYCLGISLHQNEGDENEPNLFELGIL